jgi:diadenylate cyclase
MSELFQIGFLTITIYDVLDVAVVTVLFYLVYKALQETIALQVLIGLIVIGGLAFLAETANLKSINWILKLLSDI